MNKQKPDTVDYLKIIEINENLFLFKNFLNKEHSRNECESFCIDMIQRCPELEQKFNFQNNAQFDLSTVMAMYYVYCNFVDRVYETPSIHKNIKPQKDAIKEINSFIKRKIITLKKFFIKFIILIVSILLFISSFYVEEKSYNTVLVAIATGLFSSLIFDYLIKIQKEHKEEQKREIYIIVTQCKNLKSDLNEARSNYLNNDNNEMNFYNFIILYKKLYKYIQELKSKISLNTIALKMDVKVFECYYQEKIDKEIEKIDKNYDQLKDFYLKSKQEYRDILLKPYGLAVEVIDNIIGLHVIDFSFMKDKE